MVILYKNTWIFIAISNKTYKKTEMTHNDHVYNLNENIKYFFLKKSAKHIY